MPLVPHSRPTATFQSCDFYYSLEPLQLDYEIALSKISQLDDLYVKLVSFFWREDMTWSARLKSWLYRHNLQRQL